MKKKNIIDLIKYHAENNDEAFRAEAYSIASYFDKIGDYQLAEYIMALMSNANTFVPQMMEKNTVFFKKLASNTKPLPLPDDIKDDILGVVNAVGHNAGINKFLFEGAPGTGKTETAKQVARLLDREIFSVDFSVIVDSKLGQTIKNIAALFEEISKLKYPDKVIILFDEIDAIAIDRINSNDLREMGRATTAFLKGLDSLNDKVVIIATTNLFNSFDRALVRRFDAIINFDRYTREDLIEIGVIILNDLLTKFKISGRNTKLFKKIIQLMETIPYPGELNNLIKKSIAFSRPDGELDYLKKLFINIVGKKDVDVKFLQNAGFTFREIEILTDIPKSTACRELKG